MKKHEIKVGGVYLMKVSGVVTKVRVDAIREVEGRSYGAYSGRSTIKSKTVYDCTNLRTGKSCRAESAQKFRGEVKPTPGPQTDVLREPGTWFASRPAQGEEACTIPFAGRPNRRPHS